MDRTKTTLERAFDLAQSGKFLNLTELSNKLKEERFDPDYIVGKGLRNQLLQVIKAARKH